MKTSPYLRLGLVGAGYRGVTLAKTIFETSLGEVVAGFDLQPDRAKSLMELCQHHFPLAPSLDDLVGRDDIDAFIVATPDQSHRPDILKLFELGKPIFCEKPMAISIADCDAMLLKQQETGVPLRVGLNLRHHPMYKAMQEITLSGELGRITTVWVRHFVGHGGNFYFQDWHSLQSNVNSLLLQKATHDIDLIHFLTGSYTQRVLGLGNRAYYGGDYPNDLTCPVCPERTTCPEAVLDPKVLRNHCAFRSEIDIEDNEMIMMELRSGVLASYAQCQFTPDYHRNYVVIGTRGRVESFEPMHRRGNYQNEFRLELLFRDRRPARTYHFANSVEGGHGGADPQMARDWLVCLQKGEFDAENPIAARQSVAVGCLAAQSIRGKNDWETVPPLPVRAENIAEEKQPLAVA